MNIDILVYLQFCNYETVCENENIGSEGIQNFIYTLLRISKENKIRLK